jgi:hypothetical protein
MDTIDKLKAIYDMELNIHIYSFWDGGYTVKLGDPVNGYTATGIFPNIEDGINFLYYEALKCNKTQEEMINDK